MSDRFTFSSAGLVHEMEMAMDRVGGWDAALVKVLCMGNNLGLVRDVLRGHAEVKMIKCPIIDCDADPFTPSGWEFEEHRKHGSLKWDPAKVQLFLSNRQKVGIIFGHELRKDLAGKPVLNANVLDYLLFHVHFIPEEWKKDKNGNTLFIFFWGTVYRGSGGNFCVRYLCWFNGRWSWYWFELGSALDARSPAALLASI